MTLEANNQEDRYRRISIRQSRLRYVARKDLGDASRGGDFGRTPSERREGNKQGLIATRRPVSQRSPSIIYKSENPFPVVELTP